MSRSIPGALLRLGLFLLLAGSVLPAQHLTLEGQTGGFITPTAYVVPSKDKHIFSFPAVGYHFVNVDQVIGNVQTFNITEGFANRAEIGYTREVHSLGNDPLFSKLWHFAGMNIVHGKVVLLKDGQFKTPVPGVAVGFVTRWDDKFVTGALDEAFTGTLKSYTNGDVYAAATKTWLHKPLPFLANFGLKFTNASIYGIGGQATRFGGRLFGGLGFPLPGPLHTAIVPAAGFSQQPPTSKNLDAIMYPPGSRAHLPTTLDYAVRITQRENPHFAFDVGIGQVAGMIGQTAVIGPGGTPIVIPVNLHARSVFGLGLSLRY
ncbi:DUF3034 family protein [Occallatibacter riparius]|uniref:DUF3034 family protein n=1 Tax=Occallatibacter riparius TaxID=1002689 RepID=A0A9J7BPX5_9BACT|nr:DUF3034 family protein [Occallatibacter riparius]UWZ82990.1 DUF3034 family protein [Occallatibacter riparius]